MALVSLLCVCFLSQPFQPLFAAESDSTTPDTSPEVQIEESEPESSENVPESIPSEVSEVSEDETSTDPDTASSENFNDMPNDSLDAPDSSPDDLSPNDPGSDPTPPESVTTSTNESTDDPSTSTGSSPSTTLMMPDRGTTATTATSTSFEREVPTSTATTSTEQNDSATSTAIDVSDSADDEVDRSSASNNDSDSAVIEGDPNDAPNASSATSTSLAVEEDADEPVPNRNSVTEPLVSKVESDTHLSFSRRECTRVEDGTFYCQKQLDMQNVTESLVAAPDVDGDLEIFLVREGEHIQITKNTVDDAAPYYDERSETIVWHRLINDRYQIIAFDTESGDETQVTDTKVNNMQPSRHGDRIVWQRWVDGNWDIFLYDGEAEYRITDSPRHDIAPHIRDDLIIWNSRADDGDQILRTYDIESDTYTTIKDAEGVAVANPRMVVMYEAMYENGDIVTKGFDLLSGEVVPIKSLPRQLPDELPDSEPTEETRALIQNKPEPREAEVKVSTDDTASTSPPIDDDTLDLRPTSTIATSADEATSTKSTPPPIPDLIVPAPVEGGASSTEERAQS